MRIKGIAMAQWVNRLQNKMRTKCYMRLRNNYACLQALVNNALTWQSSCVIANNARKTAKAICQRL